MKVPCMGPSYLHGPFEARLSFHNLVPVASAAAVNRVCGGQGGGGGQSIVAHGSVYKLALEN